MLEIRLRLLSAVSGMAFTGPNLQQHLCGLDEDFAVG